MRGSNWKAGLARGHPRQLLVAANRGRHVVVEPGCQIRLVIEQIHLRRTSRHEQIDGALRLGGKLGQTNIVLGRFRWCARSGCASAQVGLTDERRQRRPSQHLAGPPEEPPPRLNSSPLPLNRGRHRKVERAGVILAVGTKGMLLHYGSWAYLLTVSSKF